MTSEGLPSLTQVGRRVRFSSSDGGPIVMTTDNNRLYARQHKITIIIQWAAALTIRTPTILLRVT